MQYVPFVSSISSHLFATSPTASYTPSMESPSRNLSNTSVWNILISFNSPLRFTSKPFSSSKDPSKLNTAYRFLISLPSSFEAGKIIALYGPSTSNSMLISLRVLYPPSSPFTWYCSFVHITEVRRFKTLQGYEIFNPLVNSEPSFGFRENSSGNVPGRQHQIPSVSNSSGLPISSTSFFAIWMIFAPVYVTTPAISMEYHRAPLRMTYP